MLALAACALGCEKKDWRETNREGTIEAYRAFIEKYPDSPRAITARTKIEEQVYANAKKKHTVEAFEHYLGLYPAGEFVDFALREIKLYRKRWAEALTVDEIERAKIVFKTQMGDFTMRLLPDAAPEHSRNMLFLAVSDFYKGTVVNGVKKGSFVHMGDPSRNGLGGPGYMIEAEISELPHERGTVTMWHMMDNMDTAGSQFIVCLDRLPEFDGNYTIFAEITEGMETLDAISAIDTAGDRGAASYRPAEQVRIIDTRLEGIEPPP